MCGKHMPGICRKQLMRRWESKMGATYVFPTGGSFDSEDSWKDIFVYVLSDEDGKRLESSARRAPRRWLVEDPEIADIELRIRREAYMAHVMEFLKNKDFIKEQRDKYEKATGSKGAADLTIIRWYMEGASFRVMYPVELQELGVDS